MTERKSANLIEIRSSLRLMQNKREKKNQSIGLCENVIIDSF